MPCGRQQGRSHSAHVAFRARVHYQFHPAFGRDLEVQYREERRGEIVFVCAIADGTWGTIPTWMCDPALCARVTVGEPGASVAAMQEVREILTALGFDRRATATPARLQETTDGTQSNPTVVEAGRATRDRRDEAGDGPAGRCEKPRRGNRRSRATPTRSCDAEKRERGAR